MVWKKIDEPRYYMINGRVTETERNAVHAAAKKLKMSVSAITRKAVLSLIQELK